MLEKAKRYDSIYFFKDSGTVAVAQFGLTIEQVQDIAKAGELLIFDNMGYETWCIFDYADFPDTEYLLSTLIQIAESAGFLNSKKATFKKYMG